MRLPSFLRRTPLPRTSQPATPPPPPQESTMSPAAAPVVESMLAKVALECGGDIWASQEEVLATSSFLGGSASQDDDGEEEEVFDTRPDATQQEDRITMCTLPFTPSPSQPPSPAPPSADAEPSNPRRKPRVCTRKVRGARISTPTPSPEEPQPEQQLQAEQQQPQPEEQLQAEQQQEQPQPEEQLQAEQLQREPERPLHDDPLIRAVLMIPTRTTTTAPAASRGRNGVEDFLALARQRGLYGTQN